MIFNMQKVRGFLKIDESINHQLPTRQTKKSAGYDFYLPEDLILLPHEVKLIRTNIKAYMQDDEVLMLYIRSSLGLKKGLLLQNSTGVIDADFFPNEIHLGLKNTTDKEIKLLKNDRIVQGIFIKYLIADDGNLEEERHGGIGSTN